MTIKKTAEQIQEEEEHKILCDKIWGDLRNGMKEQWIEIVPWVYFHDHM